LSNNATLPALKDRNNFESARFFRRIHTATFPAFQLLFRSDMRKTAIVIVVAALFASTAAVSVRHQRQWTEKLDGSLTQSAQQASDDSVRVVIHVRPDGIDRIVAHLAQHGLKPQRSAGADAVAVQMPASLLRSLAGDADVVRISASLEP
jgi:hypothetical protein